VWAWGSGAGYKLGLGDQKDRYDPVLVPRLKEKIVLQVSAGAWHSLAIVLYPPMLGGGTVRLPPSPLLTSLSSLPSPPSPKVYSWGSGYHGQLAQGPKQICHLPEPVEYFYK
jgi:alpha-tubulin suppressor-like RCC1 family protein